VRDWTFGLAAWSTLVLIPLGAPGWSKVGGVLLTLLALAWASSVVELPEERRERLSSMSRHPSCRV
jgi:hypothetical protein